LSRQLSKYAAFTASAIKHLCQDTESACLATPFIRTYPQKHFRDKNTLTKPDFLLSFIEKTSNTVLSINVPSLNHQKSPIWCSIYQNMPPSLLRNKNHFFRKSGFPVSA
jgi:hypothetical protein